jgi:DNA helicase II / ATP-dependent DNA helicase PcrA
MDSQALSGLNEQQKQAVMASEGPVMIIAGAGSGKTRVLTHRVAFLLELGVDPFNVLALTFTNKAAREMKERVERMVGFNEARNVWMGTFHSVFARALRSEAAKIGYPQNFTIYDNDDSKSLLRNIVKELALDDKVYQPGHLLHRISACKSSLIMPPQYNADPTNAAQDTQARRPLFGKIYHIYNERCRKAGAMDFDDILVNMYLMLSEHPELLLKYQRKFEFILVDEYQDTNYVQYAILRKLAANNENICVVGDDAQSIYGFRGASITNILNFQRDFPDARVFKLEQNYRSTKTIVEAANHVIRNNRDQIPKIIWTDNDHGELIRVLKAATDTEEGNLIAGSIFEEKMNQQLPNRLFAVLYRTNAQSRAIEEALRKLNIPYKIYGGLSFYKRKEIKDLLAYFRLAINQNDEEALNRVINYPTRGIGQTTMEKCIVAANDSGLTLWQVVCDPLAAHVQVNAGTVRKLQEFGILIRSFAAVSLKEDAFKAAKFMATHSGILKELYEDKSPEGVSRYENIEELINAIKQFVDRDSDLIETGGDIPKHKLLADFMQDVALLTDADNNEDKDGDFVSLMTVHAAKGLEFPYVYVSGLEDGLFPSGQSLGTRADLEEERRLFYVAITRSMSKLFLAHAELRYKWGNLTICEPSRFLNEIDPKFLMSVRKARPLNSIHGAEKPKSTQGTTITKPETSSFKRKNLRPIGASAPVKSAGSTALDPDQVMPGMEVIHDKFGPGKVLQVEGIGPNRKATVFFRSVGQKQMLLSFARLQAV